ncbi:MAG: hypothetical protein ACLTOV_00085 [Phocaeicola sp.]
MRCISPYSFDERLKLAQGFLASHAVMTISDYADLTGLSQTTAGRELRKLYHDPSSGLDVKGRTASGLCAEEGRMRGRNEIISYV